MDRQSVCAESASVLEAGLGLYGRNGDVFFAELRFDGNCQIIGRSFPSVYVSQRRMADSYYCMAGRACHFRIAAG